MRARAGVATLIVSGVAIFAAAPASAQGPPRAQDPSAFAGRMVSSVTLEIEGQVETTPAVLTLISVKAGQPFKLDESAASVAQLVGAGYESVSVMVRNPEASSIDVVFRASPQHPVSDFVFRGETGLSASELDDVVTLRFFRLTTGATPESARRIVLEALAEEGFARADADVTVHQVHDPVHLATYVFDVTAGPRAEILQLELENRSSLSDRAIRDATGAAVGGPYRRNRIQMGVAALQDDLRARGFYAADITFEPTELEPDRWKVRLVVDPGPRVVARWAPDSDRPSRGDIEDYVPIALVGSVDDDVLEESRRRIEAALRNDGYKGAQASYRREMRSPAEQEVIFTATRGPRYRIRGIEVPSGLYFPPEQIRRWLNLAQGDVRNPALMQAGLEAVQRPYIEAGFYEFTADYAEQDAQSLSNGDIPVDVRLLVTEGPRGLIREVRFTPEPRGVPDLRARIASQPGVPFVHANERGDLFLIERLYRDAGYLHVAVRVERELQDAGRAVVLNFVITEGVQVLVADIRVVGNERVSVSTILEEITLHPGEPFGDAARTESTMRLNRLTSFQRVHIDEMQRAPGDARAHVVITVVESLATSIGYGGGLEVDNRVRPTLTGGVEAYLSISPRGFFEISRRNLGGLDRTLSFFSRFSLKPRSTAADASESRFGFAEYRLTGTYDERRVFNTEADLLFGATLEQAVRTTFNFSRKTLNAEAQRALWPGFNIIGRYVIDFTELFDENVPENEQPIIDRLFPQVRLSIVSTGIFWDRRNNAIDPTRGTFTTADVEFASTRLGSQVGYVKAFAQTAMFRALDAANRHVLAMRGQLGLARGFERTVPDERGEPQIVEDLPASQRFFAGGSTTVRGFEVDRLGVIPDTFTPSGLPLGGNGLVILNVELRTGVGRLFGRELGVALFSDAGNVFRRAGDVRLAKLRGTVGFGVRYNSPLGPLRLDFGFKLDRQVLGGQLERRWEYHLNLGQIF
jgi:outer membrane protein insertion porin family